MAIQRNASVGGPQHKPFPRGSGYLTILSSLTLLFIAVLAALSSPLGRQVAMASGRGSGDQEVIFTKWITAYPNMQGVVSGVVGGGLYAGEIVQQFPTPPNITKVEALYHINGSAHQFTADLIVTQNNDTGTATIHGVVTDGWQKGSAVEGGYQVINPCTTVVNAEFNLCFQGTLHILEGSER